MTKSECQFRSLITKKGEMLLIKGSLYFMFKPRFHTNLNVDSQKFENESLFINFDVLISKNYFINVNL